MQRGCFYSVVLLCLAACSGGGGGSAPGAGGGYTPPTATPQPTPTATPSIVPTAKTDAVGVVVDDANGTPLAGVRVAVEPWVAGATPLPAPQATTLADGTFALNNVPNGHYLLIVGNDIPGDTAQTTVHDNVSMMGGPQALHAPTLPPVPTITPPAWETNGSYRLSAIDATTELPCIIAFNTERTNRTLPQVVVDEWLMENSRAVSSYAQTPGAKPGPWPNNSYGWLTTGSIQNDGGGTECGLANVASDFTQKTDYAASPHTQWFGGVFVVYGGGAETFGLTQYPIDPRSFSDPNVPIWP